MNEFFRRFNWFNNSFIIFSITTIFFFACNLDWSVGKDIEDIEKELAREMFIADSLMRTIKLGLDSSLIEIDIEPLYIKSLRINNGH